MPAAPFFSGVLDHVVGSSYADALLIDGDGRVVWARGRRTRAAERDGVQLVGRPGLDLIAPGERQRGAALLSAARTTGALLVDTVRLPDGGVVEVALHDLPEVGLLVEAWDVTARDARERDLRERSLHDPLTGIANRVLLLDRLEWAMTTRRRGPPRVGRCSSTWTAEGLDPLSSASAQARCTASRVRRPGGRSSAATRT